MKFTSTHKLSASMVGSNESLSVMGAFQIVQDTITEFMGELKIDGVTVKQKYNAFWVFVKTRVKFCKKLPWGAKFAVEASISAMSAAKMHVDVRVSDEDGQTVFHARTELCVLDIATQRIKKIASVGVSECMLTPSDTSVTFGKFDTVDLPCVEQVRVRSTNVDHSHHTNNLEYLRFVMNTYSVEELETKAIREMEVVYASQSYENDVLDVMKTSCGNKDLIALEKSGKPVVKCEILMGENV